MRSGQCAGMVKDGCEGPALLLSGADSASDLSVSRRSPAAFEMASCRRGTVRLISGRRSLSEKSEDSASSEMTAAAETCGCESAWA